MGREGGEERGRMIGRESEGEEKGGGRVLKEFHYHC